MNYLQKLYTFSAVLILAPLTKDVKAKRPEQEYQNICNAQSNGTIVVHPNDCQKFYICIQQKSYEYNCNAGYYYDTTTRNCMLEHTSCNSEKNKTATCTMGKIRAVQQDCNIYEACVKGQYQKLKCPAGYYFHAQQTKCVPFQYDVEFKCKCLMPEYTILENKNNCETYFVCHGKFAVLENCPLGQYYNATLNTCLNDLEGICLTKPIVLESVNINKTDNINKEVRAARSKLRFKSIHFQTFPKGEW